MKLVLRIAYDGSAYSGYQSQPDKPSVQKALTDAVSNCFGFPCTVTGCSRTDAGVHALGFCVAVQPACCLEENWLRIPIGRVHRALKRFLPPDICVNGEAAADDSFHPRYSAVSKEYIYRMYDSPEDDPFLRERAWHLRHRLTDDAIEKMNIAGQSFLGEHDFTSFMAAGSKITDARRTIHSLHTARSGNNIELKVSANGFLYNMVRIITGTLVDAAVGTIDFHEISQIIDRKDRTAAGKTAPPYGLYLNKVTYDRDIDFVIM